jgi:nitroreductase
MTANPRTPEADVDREFLDRWSPRAFRQDPISKVQLASLFEAMRWAPSCFNEQPWRLCYGLAGEPAHARIVGLLVEANQWAAKAPLLIVLFNRRNFSHNDKPNRTAPFDTGAAWMSLALEARKLGLYSHGMAGFDAQRAYTELGADPEIYEVQAADRRRRPRRPRRPSPTSSAPARKPPTTATPQENFVFPRRDGQFPRL